MTAGNDRSARSLYSAGLIAYGAHMVAAFAGPYAWSWDRALSETARISAEKVGIESANGLWWNAAFAVVWLVDALRWWVQGVKGYGARGRWWRWSVDTFMAFMVFNGAVIFAAGPVRWFGLTLFAMLAYLAARQVFARGASD